MPKDIPTDKPIDTSKALSSAQKSHDQFLRNLTSGASTPQSADQSPKLDTPEKDIDERFTKNQMRSHDTSKNIVKLVQNS